MKSSTPLSHSHQRTFDRIFQHPISHNLEWRDVHALLNEWGEVEKEHNGNLKVTRNGHTLVLRPTSHKDVAEMDEVMALRHFLEKSEPAAPNPSLRKKEDDSAEDHFTITARKAAETNEGGLVDPKAS
jgi:hypothetical protein